MTQGDVLFLFGDALYLVVIAVAVLILPSLIVGLVVSVFQAATQINEQTLSFLPRLLTTLVTIMVVGPWLLGEMVDTFRQLMFMIPGLIG
jgi:flagellar biosynthesis protein FliQ